MTRLPSLPNPATDETWRYPLVGGLISAAYTAVQYWYVSPGTLQFESVLLAGLLGGALYNGRPTPSHRIGFRTGLVGSLPAVLLVPETLAFVAGLAQPAWFGVVQSVLVVGIVVVAVALSATAGMLAAMLGDWLVEKTRRHRPAANG